LTTYDIRTTGLRDSFLSIERNMAICETKDIPDIVSRKRPNPHMNDRNERLMNDYKDRRPLFAEFNVAIFKLLQNMLDEGHYKYQITYRTKALGSLRQKLTKKEKEGRAYRRLEDMKDLAGVRIIFYFEKDKNRFVKEIGREISGRLIVERIKKRSGYKAKHVIVVLGPKRLALNEYKRFRRLKCEVQLTSILYHAWSEIEHDLIYKNMDTSQKQSLKRDLDKILKDHIQKAVSDIERISRYIKR